MSDKKVGSVLFICLGNICRSPIAEAVFQNEVTRRGVADKWDIDSAALESWHTGKSPDSRAVACLAKHKMTTKHHARQVKTNDFHTFDLILGMDNENIEALRRLAPQSCRAKVMLLGEFDPQKELIIEDPYYGGPEGFDIVYEQCVRCCKSLFDQFAAVTSRH